MKKLSVVITVKNEENRIERCLEAVKWADEIIVVDNGSTDRTLDLCRRYTDKIFFSDSQFTGIRINCGIDRATTDWILNVDADEIVTEKLKEEILQVLKNEQCQFSGYFMPICSCFIGRWLAHGGWYPCYTKRFYRQGKAMYAKADHHIQVEISGKIGYLINPLLHYGTDNISNFIKKMNFYTTNSAKINYGTKKISLFDITLRPALIFIKRYFVLRGFLDGFPGFIIAMLSSICIFVQNSKYLELEKLSRKNNHQAKADIK